MHYNAGYDALEDLKSAVKSGNRNQIAEATAQFYTIIPHAFGRTTPPLITTREKIDEKVDLLNTLAQIEDGVKMRTKAKSKKRAATKILPHPSDQHYEELCADLDVLSPKSKEFAVIKKSAPCHTFSLCCHLAQLHEFQCLAYIGNLEILGAGRF